MTVSLLLHMQNVPYKRKFHNLMEYVTILATILTLFCGLLFYVEKFPNLIVEQMIQAVAIIVMITATIFVILMVIWDYQTRRKKDAKKLKRRVKDLLAELSEKQRKGEPTEVLELKFKYLKTKFDDQGNVLFVPPFYHDIPESDEESVRNINEIIEKLFTLKRLKRKLFLVDRKRRRVQASLSKVVRRK